jgi:hypothetical protein
MIWGRAMAQRFGMTVAGVLAAALLGLGGAGPSAATSTFVIDTTGFENSGIDLFGVPNTAIYGQTVRVPEGFPVLTSFAVRMFDRDQLIFRGAVWAYTPGALPGDPLWEGPEVQLGTSGTIVTITFTPNLRLTPGTTYVIGATTLSNLDQDPRGTEWRSSPESSYPDGQFVFFNQGPGGSPGWEPLGFGRDLSFRATFAQSATSGGLIATDNEPIALPPVEHTLGFNANGGDCTLTNSGPIIDGVWTQVPTAEQCTRPGFTLLGWNPKPDGSDPLGFDPGGFTLMTDHNTLYAIWVPVS